MNETTLWNIHKLQRKDREDSYLEFQGIIKTLVGKKILFQRGLTQQVFAEVLEWCEHSLHLKIKNIETNRVYDIDVFTMDLKDIV